MKKLLYAFGLLIPALLAAQQPQTQNAPIYPVNAKYVQGVAPGYWPTGSAGTLTLNIAAGTAFCGGAVQTYAGGTLTMTASTTNYVYLDTTASCAPAVNTTGFTTSTIPVAVVVTGSSAITSITDDRTFFAQTSAAGPGGGVTSIIPGANVNCMTLASGKCVGDVTVSAAAVPAVLETGSFTPAASTMYHLNCASACTVTLPATPTAGFSTAIQNTGTGQVTITSGGPTYDGVTGSVPSNPFPQGQSIYIDYDGTSYHSTGVIKFSTGLATTTDAHGTTVTASGTGGSSAASIPLPLTTANTGAGMVHLTDSTGPGNVYVSAGAPPNGTGAAPQCPGASNAFLDTLYLRTDVMPFQYSTCYATGWKQELPGWSTTEILFQNYNQLSSQPNATGDYPYPGTHYSNSSGIINTGDAASGDVFAIEALPWENPPDTGAYTYFIQDGVGTWLNWSHAIGWGSITNGPVYETGADTAAIMWLGTPLHGKLLASNAATTGTWTHYDPTVVTTTGTFSSGSTAVTVASGTGLAQYFQVADTTNPAAIPAGTYVSSATGMSVVLSGNTAAAGSGDTLTFTNPSTPPFRAGVAMCGTGGTMTFTTMPASGAVYVAWIEHSGTDAATLTIDGVSQGTITSGDAGGWYTNHETYMWYGKRYAVTGSGAHTVVIAPTSGTFCPLFVVAPNPASWNGMQQPLVVQAGMPPAGSGYNGLDNQLTAAQSAVVAQAKADGFNVQYADLFAGWPESQGVSTYCEHSACSYANGLTSNQAASPHFTILGDEFNGWAFLRAARHIQNSPPNVVGDGSTAAVTQVGAAAQVSVIQTNLDKLNQANTHTTGNQVIRTGNATNPGLDIYGTGSALVPSVVQSVSTNGCSAATLTTTAGNAILWWKTNATVPSDGVNTYTQIYHYAAGGYYVFYAYNIAGGATTFSPSGCGDYTNIWEIHNSLNSSSPIDVSTDFNLTGTAPPILTVGPITTTTPNDLIMAFYEGCYSSLAPGIDPSYSTANSLWPGQEGEGMAYKTGATASAYTVSYGNIPCSNTFHSLIALKGGVSSGQTAHPFRYFDANGVEQFHLNGAGNPELPSCTGKILAADGSGCVSSSGSFTAAGDLSGNSASQEVVGLRNVPFCTGISPANGQFYQYTTASSPNPCITTASTSGSFTASGDLSGTSSSQKVVGINNVPLCAGFTPTNGQAIQYTTASSPDPCWTAATTSGSSLPTETHAASSSASLNFTSCLSSSYDAYRITFKDLLTATDSVEVGLRYSTNGGSSYDSGSDYDWVTNSTYLASGSSPSTTLAGKHSDTLLQISNSQTSTATGALSGYFVLIGVNSTASYKQLTGFYANTTWSGQPATQNTTAGGSFNTTTVVNAFQVIASSGNLASGSVTCQPLQQ